jgi:serine/threonine protein kinase
MLIGGRYETIRELSKGGVGKTYLADDTYRRGGPKVVVKRYKPRMNHSVVLQAAREIFEAEAKVFATLGKHDQIPRQVAYFEQNSEFYLVQEFIDGHSLKLPLGIKLEEDEAIALLQEVLEVMVFVQHHKVIHLDINPNNLLRRWRDRKLTLLDFGSIKVIRTLGLDASGALTQSLDVGTPGYVPKEQQENNPQLCSDVYSIGMIIIQALTGFLPNQLPRDPDMQEVIWHDQAPQISQNFSDILDYMVCYDPAIRFQTAADVLEALGLPVPEVAQIAPPIATQPQPEVKKPGYSVISPRFDLGLSFYEALAPVVVGGKLGYINRTGDFAIQPRFPVDPRNIFRQSTYQFSEGLACVDENGLWGYITEAGNLVIPAQYASGERFAEGLARVELDHKYGYIDKTGRLVVPIQYDTAARTFSEGLAGVEVDRCYGYINKLGKLVIAPTFESGDRFTEGLARVTMNHKYGFINPQGHFDIPPRFDVAHRFSDGLARVRVEDRYGYIDRSGAIVIMPQFDDNASFSEGLAWVRNGEKYGFIDKTGKLVVRLEFDDVISFSEGLAAVRVGNKWGYIDTAGVFVINLQFDDARSFINGVAAVKIDGKWGYIGK